MTLDPFLAAPLHIQIHALAATFAVVAGPVALYRRRRDRLHWVIGYLWIAAMLCVAISAFFIHSFAVIGPFSPLHGFALLTLWSLWTGVAAARRGDIRRHNRTFRNLYWFGLMTAGAANFLPGRMVNEAAFGGRDQLGWIALALAAAVIARVAWAGRGAAAGALPAATT